MKVNKSIVIGGLALGIVGVENIVNAEGNLSPAKNKLRADSSEFLKLGDTKNKYAAGIGSTFYIYSSNSANETLTIKFKKVKKPECADEKLTAPCTIVNNSEFFTFSMNKIPNYYYRKSLKFDHGLLVIPFKFRTEDQSLSGQSTLGYYFGNKSEYLSGSGTYFGSIGLSQVDVPVSGKSTETKTGLSISGGYIFESIDGFQVALVVGSDRLGGSAGDDWVYEKDIWVSIGLGFNLASK